MQASSTSAQAALFSLPVHHTWAYLLGTAGCLIIALRLMRRAWAPIGPLIRAAAAAVLITVAVGAALVFVAAAAFAAR